MTYIHCTTIQPQLIAVAKLEKSTLNARRTVRPDGIGELKASILSHGLMQNLVVTVSNDDTYRVIAGSRRLEAIHSLQAEGKLPPDFAVPCQIVTEEYALEMSLAENTIRLAMHPADQFQAFAELIDKGATAAEVAQRFGVEESLVHKRMKLARVRNDGMTLECLMAYTLTDDHRRQRKVFKSLQDWQKAEPSAIRDALTEKMIDAGSKLARFVGLDAYTAAGGYTRADLFGEEMYLEKPALVNKLAEKKLDAIRLELEAEGWNWIEINPERDWELVNKCSRIKPMLVNAPAETVDLKSQLDRELEDIERALDDTESGELLDRQKAVRDYLDRVEEALAAFVGFDTGQKALAGCFVSIGQDGTPFIDKGLVRPEHRKQLARLLNADDAATDAVRTKDKGALPETLRRDLADARLRIAQVEIAKHPLIALDVLVFQAALSVFDERASGDGADVRFNLSPVKLSTEGAASIADAAFDAVAKSLPLDWLKPKGEIERFELFRLLPESAKLDILAYSVASTLKPKLASVFADDTTAYDMALSLTTASVADYWRPTKDNFLGRANREQLLAIGREVFGEQWSQSRYADKKASLVDQLHRAFSDPDKAGRTPGKIERLKCWLPAGMSFSIADMMTQAKASKAA